MSRSSFNVLRYDNKNNDDEWTFSSIFIFIPYFTLYLFLSTILSFFLRGSRTFARTFLAVYTWIRLFIGIQIIITLKLLKIIINKCIIIFDSFHISKKETALLDKYRNSFNYYEWFKVGNELNKLSKKISYYKNTPNSNEYDYELLQTQLNNIKSKLNDGNVKEIMQSIQFCFRRSFCSLQNENLYNHCYVGGTKHIINEYYRNLENSINFICDDESTNNNIKLDFFYRAKKSLGRTALCLSGGGSLSLIHTGVLRSLIKQKALPKVISGTSGGSILAGYLATLTDDELYNNLDTSLGTDISTKFGVRFLPTFFEQLFSGYSKRVLMDTEYFINAMKKYTGDMTFLEAYKKTGRHVSIVVTYSTKNVVDPDQKSKIAHHILLNHITSPDVYIYSAVK